MLKACSQGSGAGCRRALLGAARLTGSADASSPRSMCRIWRRLVGVWADSEFDRQAAGSKARLRSNRFSRSIAGGTPFRARTDWGSLETGPCRDSPAPILSSFFDNARYRQSTLAVDGVVPRSRPAQASRGRSARRRRPRARRQGQAVSTRAPGQTISDFRIRLHGRYPALPDSGAARARSRRPGSACAPIGHDRRHHVMVMITGIRLASSEGELDAPVLSHLPPGAPARRESRRRGTRRVSWCAQLVGLDQQCGDGTPKNLLRIRAVPTARLWPAAARATRCAGSQGEDGVGLSQISSARGRSRHPNAEARLAQTSSRFRDRRETSIDAPFRRFGGLHRQ